MKEASLGRPLIRRSTKHRNKIPRPIFDRDRQDDILLSSYNLTKLSDDSANGLIAPREYYSRACELWHLISDDRNAIVSTSRFLSGVPAIILATTLLPLKNKYPSLNLLIGTEVRCVSGMRTNGLPDEKDQDVAIAIPTEVAGLPYKLGISTYECKENYIDTTMSNSPNTEAVGALAVCDFAKAEVFTPSICGKVDFFEQVTVRHLCRNDPNFARNRHYGGDPHRQFDIDVFDEIYDAAEAHVASLTPDMIAEWTMCPTYSAYKARKAIVTVNGDQEALDELSRLIS